jgi:hypothetical protein
MAVNVTKAPIKYTDGEKSTWNPITEHHNHLLKLSRRMNAVQFYWEISRINVRIKINVSETSSVSIIGVDDGDIARL